MILIIGDNLISTDEIIGIEFDTIPPENELVVNFLGGTYCVVKNNEEFLNKKHSLEQELRNIKSQEKNIPQPSFARSFEEDETSHSKAKKQEIDDLYHSYGEELQDIRLFIAKYKENPINDTDEKYPMFTTKYTRVRFPKNY